MPRHSPDRSDYPVLHRRNSPRYRSSFHKDRSPLARRRSSGRSISPVRNSPSYIEAARSPPLREKHHSSRVRSTNHSEALLNSPHPRSPSPHLKRGDAEKHNRRAHRRLDDRSDAGIDKERDYRNNEKGIKNDVVRERVDKRLAWDGIEGEETKLKRHRSISPADRRQRARHYSRSPPRASRNGARDDERDSHGSEQPMPDDSISRMQAAEKALKTKQMEKPSFELSGKLAAETNRIKGITLLFNEAPDARKPDIRWRLYVFKAAEVLNEPLYIHRQSCYLFGRERRVADIPTDHPSCSKQHAIIQFREVEKEQADGMLSRNVRPYLMDLGSTNKTFLNDNPIEAQRYYELFEKDTIKFGNSSREYVLLHENSTAV